MRFLGLIFLLAPMWFSAAVADDMVKLRVAIEGDFPPFSVREADGSLSGFDVDIARALCNEIGAECDLVQQSWDGMIPGLLAMKFDLIVASMSITEERKRKVAFTRKYWNAPSFFIGRKGRFETDTPEELAEKVIGVQAGTIQDHFVSALYADSDVKRYQNLEEAYLDLISGRLDAVLAAGFQADLGFLKSKDGKDFTLFGKGHSDPAYFGEGAGVALRKGDEALRERLDAAILTLREKGIYQAINAKYTDVDLYGE